MTKKNLHEATFDELARLAKMVNARGVDLGFDAIPWDKATRMHQLTIMGDVVRMASQFDWLVMFGEEAGDYHRVLLEVLRAEGYATGFDDGDEKAR